MEEIRQQGLSVETLEAFLKEISAAAKRLAMYPSGHPACKRSVEKPYRILTELWQTAPDLVISLVDGKLVADGKPIEDRFLEDGLGKIIGESDLQSVQFRKDLTSEELERFLTYLNVKKEERDLEHFLNAERIKNITIGHLRYELVGDDETVVPSHLLNNGTGSGTGVDSGSGESLGEWKQLLADTLRNNPTQVMRMMLNKLAKNKGGMAELKAVNDGDGVYLVESEDSDRIVPDVQISHNQLVSELGNLDDEDLLRLLAVGLKESVEETNGFNQFEISQALIAFKGLLEQNKKSHLLPKLNDALKEIKQLDKRYVELILAEGSSPKKVAHTALEDFQKSFTAGDVNPGQLPGILGWLEMISDHQYEKDFFKKLYSGMAEKQFDLSDNQYDTLKALTVLSAENIDEDIARIQLNEIKERLSDPAIMITEFKLLAEQLELFYFKFLELEEYEEAEVLLNLIDQKLSEQIIYSENIVDHAEVVQRKLVSAQVAERVLLKVTHNFERSGKRVVQLLEHFSNVEAILVLASYLSHQERGLRVLLLRILSGFGEATLRAFKLLLSDRTFLSRPADQDTLSGETWYKIRNMIFVLGNINHLDSVVLVSKFADDRDERVVIEVLNALEKLGGPRAVEIAARHLRHPAKEIQLKALHVINQQGTTDDFPVVEEYFLRTKSERLQTLVVLIKLDKKRTLEFFASVLIEESELYRKHYSKPDEELNELIVKTFIQLRTSSFDDVLRHYVMKKSRSIIMQWRKPASVKLAERYLKSISGQR